MCGTKCPTVRSDGTTSMRSALMPTLMTSRASMICPIVVPALRRDPYAEESRWSREANAFSNTNARGYGSPPSQGRQKLLLRRGCAFHKGLAALHLVGERRFVDLDHDRIGVDAKVLDQRLRDVAHHAGLLLVGAAG